MVTIVGIGGIDVSDRQVEFFPLQPLPREYHPLDLVLRFDPVALPLDQTAMVKDPPGASRRAVFLAPAASPRGEILTLRPSHAQNAQGLTAKRGQRVCDSLRKSRGQSFLGS
jgi:hypothetical protein